MKLRLTCREMTRLVLEGELRTLGPIERMTMRLHWLVCEACVRFRRQNLTMRVAIDRWRAHREE